MLQIYVFYGYLCIFALRQNCMFSKLLLNAFEKRKLTVAKAIVLF